MSALFLAAALAATAPDPTLTPGEWRTDLSREQICATHWGHDARHVSAAMKRKVFAAYGYARGNHDPRCPCEIDHRVPRELGGADTLRNLWPQSYRGVMNARDKDRLEDYAHHAVCDGSMALATARAWFMGDWRVAYRRVWGQ